MKNRGSKTYANFSPLDGLALGLLCIGSPEPIERNPFNCVRLSSVSELNRTQSDGLSSICSIEFDLFGNRTHWKCGVRFRSLAKLNRTQSMDWVRLSSIFERLLCRESWALTSMMKIWNKTFASTKPSNIVKPVLSGNAWGMAHWPLNTDLTNLRVIQENTDGERVKYLSHNKLTSKCFYTFLSQKSKTKSPLKVIYKQYICCTSMGHDVKVTVQ